MTVSGKTSIGAVGFPKCGASRGGKGRNPVEGRAEHDTVKL